MKLKRLLCSAATVVALTATLVPTTTTALAASSTEYASNDYVFLVDDIETKELSGSYSKVTFEADKGAVGNDDVNIH